MISLRKLILSLTKKSCRFQHCADVQKRQVRFLKTAFAAASASKYKYGVKLVRGAYMEKEAARAKKDGYPNPIHSSKEATDQSYNMALRFIIDNIDNMAATIAL